MPEVSLEQVLEYCFLVPHLASVMPISTGSDADGMPMAGVSVTGDNSDGLTSGVRTDGRSSTRAIDSDGGATYGTERNSSRLISVEDSSDIVGGGPRAGCSSYGLAYTSHRRL